MATALVTWELGGGLGHLLPLAPLVGGFRRRGHRVVVALGDLSRAGGVFGREGVCYLQAPLRLGEVADHIRRPRTFAHVLHNVGFAHAEELRTRADAWRNLYDFVRPDVILFDHSPMALLAARGHPARRLDPTLVGRRCDRAVLNAAATVRRGAGLSAGINRPAEIAVKLMSLPGSEDHAEPARRSAGRRANFYPGYRVGKALERIEDRPKDNLGTWKGGSPIFAARQSGQSPSCFPKLFRGRPLGWSESPRTVSGGSRPRRGRAFG